jgi:hypothetical protein
MALSLGLDAPHLIEFIAGIKYLLEIVVTIWQSLELMALQIIHVLGEVNSCVCLPGRSHISGVGNNP